MTPAERVPPAVGKLAGAALAGGGVLATAVLARFAYLGLSGQRRLTAPADLVLYYVVPAIAALLLFLSLRLDGLGRMRVLVATGAVVLALYAGEGFLRVFDNARLEAVPLLEGQLKPMMTRVLVARDRQGYGQRLAARFGRPIDARTPAEVIASMRGRGIDAERIITATNQLFLPRPDGRIESAIHLDGREVVPLASVSNTRTLLCNESGEWIDFQSDRRGFNNPDGVWRLPRVDIAALGDSFTEGYCVPPGRAFVDLIRARRPATINLGVSGDGPLMELATLEEFLPRLAPKVVLWFYFEGNDLTDLQIERRNGVLLRYLDDGFSQPDLARQADLDRAMLAEVPRLIATEAENARRRQWSLAFDLIAFAKLTSIRERLSPIARTDAEAQKTAADLGGANLDTFRDIVARARARVADWGGTLYFVYLPEWSRYTKYTSWGIVHRDEVLQIVRTAGVPIIDLDPAFRATGDPLSLFPFREVGHYAENGHRLVADEILRQLPVNGRIQ